jgi:hypothetical protein
MANENELKSMNGILSKKVAQIVGFKDRFDDMLPYYSMNGKVIKGMIDEIKRSAYELFTTSTELSNQIQDSIVKNCKHDYVPDNRYFDPCRTIIVCQNCGDAH